MHLKSKTAAKATLNIHSVYEEETWTRKFAKFRSENFTLKNKDRTPVSVNQSPVQFGDELLMASLEENPAVSVEDLKIKLRSNHTTVHRHLQQLRKVPKLSKWVTLDLL